MTGFLNRSRIWHERRHEINTKVAGRGGAVDDGMWLAGLPDSVANGLSIRVLRTRNELEDEGRNGVNDDGSRGLNHCVGDYWTRCAEGRSRIVSVRRRNQDGTEERLSTAEIEVYGAGNEKYALEQHRGIGNSAPEAACERAVAEYLEALRKNPSQVDVEALEPLVIGPRCGYDPKEPGTWERARDAWKDFLPRPMRGWSPEDFSSVADFRYDKACIAIREKLAENETPAPRI
jgi:hypothetical protein